MPLITKSVTVAALVMTLAALGCGGTFSSPGGGPLALVPSGATKIEQWDVAMLLNEEGTACEGFRGPMGNCSSRSLGYSSMTSIR